MKVKQRDADLPVMTPEQAGNWERITDNVIGNAMKSSYDAVSAVIILGIIFTIFIHSQKKRTVTN